MIAHRNPGRAQYHLVIQSWTTGEGGATGVFVKVTNTVMKTGQVQRQPCFNLVWYVVHDGSNGRCGMHETFHVIYSMSRTPFLRMGSRVAPCFDQLLKWRCSEAALGGTGVTRTLSLEAGSKQVEYCALGRVQKVAGCTSACIAGSTARQRDAKMSLEANECWLTLLPLESRGVCRALAVLVVKADTLFIFQQETNDNVWITLKYIISF